MSTTGKGDRRAPTRRTRVVLAAGISVALLGGLVSLSASATPTPGPTASPLLTATATPNAQARCNWLLLLLNRCPKPTPTPTPTLTPTPTPTPTPTATPTLTPTPTATPTPTPTSTSGGLSCGGEDPVKANGAPWVCTFDDEFDASTGDATALDTSKWTPQLTATSGYTTGPPGSHACYVNTPNNISVSGGYLDLTARKEAKRFTCANGIATQYTAGDVSSVGNFSQTYGRFEVRAKLPQVTAKGLQETLWLWPNNDTKYGAYPRSGEIDFAEFYSQYSDRVIPYIHYKYSTTNAATNTNVITEDFDCKIDYKQFNDYAVVWEPGTITLSYNGTTCLTDNYVPSSPLVSPEPFNQPFFVVLTQALGVGTNKFNPSTTPLPATTQVDYVRVWR